MGTRCCWLRTANQQPGGSYRSLRFAEFDLDDSSKDDSSSLSPRGGRVVLLEGDWYRLQIEKLRQPFSWRWLLSMRRTHGGGPYRQFDGAYALRDRTHRQFDGNTQSYIWRRGQELSIASYTDISDDSTTVLQYYCASQVEQRLRFCPVNTDHREDNIYS